MTRSCSLLVLSLLVGGLLAGCDITATQPESQVAVQAYLQAEAPLDTVRLTRTVGAGDTFDPQATGVQGADVEVRQLDDNGNVVATTPYSEDSTPGVYTPMDMDTVQPATPYQLHVETGDGSTITSTTTVPGTIQVVDAKNPTTEYQCTPIQPALTIKSPPRPPSGRQNVYVFTVESLLPKNQLADNFTPFYDDQYDADEDSLESFRINSSGLLNEGNFSEGPDGITVDLPWLGIAFYGANEVAINVVDDNFYDFLRSQSAQQGSFAPGEIPNVIEHVDGGTGVFGSYARAARNFDIQRDEEFTGSPCDGP